MSEHSTPLPLELKQPSPRAFSRSRLLRRLWPWLLAVVALVVVLLPLAAPTVIGSAYAAVGERALLRVYQQPAEQTHLANARAAYEQARRWLPAEPMIYQQLARVYLLQHDAPGAVKMLEQAHRLLPMSLLVRQELVEAYIAAGDRKRAATLLRATGQSAESLAQAGSTAIEMQDYALAIRHYEMALILAPRDEWVWRRVGRLCQLLTNYPIDLCARSLQASGGNLLVDAEFHEPDVRTFWVLFEHRPEINYSTGPCPGLADKTCGSVQVQGGSIGNGGGFMQCIHLVPGAQYRFSVWLQVETDPEGQWRPLYFGGMIAGRDSGQWLGGGYLTGSGAWRYWQYLFTAPAFDNNLACFHPIRLEAAGQAWFHSPKLELMQQP